MKYRPVGLYESGTVCRMFHPWRGEKRTRVRPLAPCWRKG